jgi:hypothetical protein
MKNLQALFAPGLLFLLAAFPASAREAYVDGAGHSVTLSLPDGWKEEDEKGIPFFKSRSGDSQIMVVIADDEKKSPDQLIAKFVNSGPGSALLEQPKGSAIHVSKYKGKMYRWRNGKDMSNSVRQRTMIILLGNGYFVLANESLFAWTSASDAKEADAVLESLVIKP